MPREARVVQSGSRCVETVPILQEAQLQKVGFPHASPYLPILLEPRPLHARRLVERPRRSTNCPTSPLEQSSPPQQHLPSIGSLFIFPAHLVRVSSPCKRLKTPTYFTTHERVFIIMAGRRISRGRLHGSGSDTFPSPLTGEKRLDISEQRKHVTRLDRNLEVP